MKPWAEWCVDHKLTWLVYLSVIFLSFPIQTIVLVFRAVVEALDDSSCLWNRISIAIEEHRAK
jgi:hypothetical protein